MEQSQVAAQEILRREGVEDARCEDNNQTNVQNIEHHLNNSHSNFDCTTGTTPTTTTMGSSSFLQADERCPRVLPKKRSSKNTFVKSRGELLQVENEYYENLRRSVIRNQRTKIIATINQNNYRTFEQVRSLYLAGVSSFLINMAYCEPAFLMNLVQWRAQLESEFHSHIPLTCVLKGSLVRIGMLAQPEIYLRKGQEFRIIVKKRIIGDSNICSVDDDDLIKRIGVGAKIIIDYGSVGLTVIRREKSDATLAYLQTNFGYGKRFLQPMSDRRRKTEYFMQQSSSSDMETSSSTSATGAAVASNRNSIENEQQQQQPTGQLSSNLTNSASQPCRNVFAEQLTELKKAKKKTTSQLHDVIVCTADSDCLLKSYKPIFLYKSRDEKEQLFEKSKKVSSAKRRSPMVFEDQTRPLDILVNDHHSTKGQDCDGRGVRGYNEGDDNTGDADVDDNDSGALEEENEEYDVVSESILNPKDIKDITNALNLGIDTICVSNVRTAEDILAVRKYCAFNHTKIFAKIQTLEGVQNFEEIQRVSDGVLIARGYLTVYIPVEKLHYKQRELIRRSNEKLKPVLVSCNILDSMVSSLLPTTCEVGEIANLVSDQVDGIVLSGETSYGMHPIQAIETLSRICVETEARRQQSVDTFSYSSVRGSCAYASYLLAQHVQTVSNSIIQCTVEAARTLKASLIIVFTSTGATALKLSKMRPPCQIIAVTADQVVARSLNYLSSVTGKVFESLTDTNTLVTKVMRQAKSDRQIREGDFVIVTSGEIENLSGTTNNLKILAVDSFCS